MAVRGIRGAISVGANSREEIGQATRELLRQMMEKNDFTPEDIASAFFTMTKDLNAEFPAKAAREDGWQGVPMMCGREIDVPGSLPGMLRVTVHINTEKAQHEIKHIYLKDAVQLRPDWAEEAK